VVDQEDLYDFSDYVESVFGHWQVQVNCQELQNHLGKIRRNFMAITDPIADMFTRIRNALQVQHNEVLIPHSKGKQAIAKILKDEGFIKHFEVVQEDLRKKLIKVILKYSKTDEPIIKKIDKVSTPGNRRYVKKCDIPKVLNGFGISILSTSKGVMTGRQARINNTGGELLGIVY
jgi:small subunit ribosomal protein S8